MGIYGEGRQLVRELSAPIDADSSFDLLRQKCVAYHTMSLIDCAYRLMLFYLRIESVFVKSCRFNDSISSRTTFGALLLPLRRHTRV